MIHLKIIANIISCWNFIKIFEQNLSIQTYRKWKYNMSTRQKCSSDQKITINNMTVQCWGNMFGLDEEVVMKIVGNIVWMYRSFKLKSWLRKCRVIYTWHAKLVLSFIYIYISGKNNMSSDQTIIINIMTVQCWGDMFGLVEEAVMKIVGNIVWIYRSFKLKSSLRKFRFKYSSHAELVLSFILSKDYYEQYEFTMLMQHVWLEK